MYCDIILALFTGFFIYFGTKFVNYYYNFYHIYRYLDSYQKLSYFKNYHNFIRKKFNSVKAIESLLTKKYSANGQICNDHGIEAKIKYIDQALQFLDHVLKMISQRNYHIKNAIEWEKFINGST